MPSYRLVNSGKIQRREYLTENHSSLFQGFPEPVFAQEQKLSYDNFLTEKLPQLLSFYFPAEFSNYNNKVKISIKDTKVQEPKIKREIEGKEIEVEMNEEEARNNSLT